ncbi:MAG: GatB/YqeY domain-containing protein [Ectothiorhodospiraceae bacterium]|nr:GatB/YqeY domain-containing protein [Ectothiorhodospiraceae bacterium]
MAAGSELKSRITDAVKEAMRAGDKPRVAALRLITAAIKQREVDERVELDDDQIIALLSKQVKQRQESIQQYDANNRPDLAEKERYEIGILEEFLPQPLSADEVEALIQEAIRESGAGSIQDMGKVMGLLRPKLQGRADMGAASARVKALLG